MILTITCNKENKRPIVVKGAFQYVSDNLVSDTIREIKLSIIGVASPNKEIELVENNEMVVVSVRRGKATVTVTTTEEYEQNSIEVSRS